MFNIANLLRDIRERLWPSVTFFSVQSEADCKRLLKNQGLPWPTDPLQASLGPGVYGWRNLPEARAYASSREERLGVPIKILAFKIGKVRLRSFKAMDVDAQIDPTAWMTRYSAMYSETAED